jgi:3-oxoacyl-[acyl-carrier protein] reductase
MQLDGIEGRVALVTGAARGIGRSIAETLRDQGARVAGGDLDPPEVANVLGVELDVADEQAVDAAFARVEAELGPVDLLVLNAGIFVIEPFEETTLASWRGTLDVNLTGAYLCARRALGGMRERGFGRVVAIGSMAVNEPIDALQLSNAHRPGLVAAFKVLARQFAADGVTLNTVHPGRIATDRLIDTSGSREAAEASAHESVPARRLGTPEELAAAAVFLCSAQASYITGTSLLVDGGLTRSV